MSNPLTLGIHHIGLAVPDLARAEEFFVAVLGWKVVGGVPTYPSVFVSDGSITLTLWRVADPERAIPFDRRENIGLHHLALKVPDRVALVQVFDKVRAHPGVVIEHEPGPMREGSPTQHFLCFMPGGVRLEFASAT